MTEIADIQKVQLCFENSAAWQSFFFFLRVLEEYDEKGTLHLSVVNLVGKDNS